jgi:protocatechuate 3,4-dioxygenase beta subunit
MGTIVGRIGPAAVLVLGLATAAAAQYSAAIRGVIHDAAGRPAPGVVVTITHPKSPGIRVAVTDLRGEYVVRGLEPGAEYVVRVTHPDFRTRRLQARARTSAQDVTPVLLQPRRSATAR